MEEIIKSQPLESYSDLGLLELICQLYFKARYYDKKEYHDEYVAARKEMEIRITGMKIQLDLLSSEEREEKEDWRDAAKELANNIVNKPNLYGIYTIYEEIEKIARMIDPTIPEPKIIKK